MSIQELRAEWNTDAFVIDPRLVLRKCKELAHQQVSLARRLKQPFDVTPEKLVALYKKQRGRCAISGHALTYSPGDRHATSINLDHIVDIQRGKSLDAVAAGGSSVGGNAGMMDNLRFVCQSMHYIREKLEGASPDFGDLRARLAVWFELGSPCNDNIDIASVQSFITSHVDVEKAILQMTNEGNVRLTVKQITQRLTMAGLQFTYTHVLRFVSTVYGVAPKSIAQKHRVHVACVMLLENQGFIDSIGSGVDCFARIDCEYVKLLSETQFDGVTDTTRREDICVAYAVVTGKHAPQVAKSHSKLSKYVKAKVNQWSRPTSMNRLQAFRVIELAGRDGIAIDAVADQLIERDPLASINDGNAYAHAMRAMAATIVEDIHAMRWIDVVGRVCVARVKLAEAAAITGHTANTLRRYCKIGIGPSYELASFGGTRQFSFSHADLFSWVQSRKEVRRVRGGIDIDGFPLQTASACLSGMLFD
jgi:hypothetical protein